MWVYRFWVCKDFFLNIFLLGNGFVELEGILCFSGLDLRKMLKGWK